MIAKSKVFDHLVGYSEGERKKDMEMMDKNWEQVMYKGMRISDYTLSLRTPGGTISASLEEDVAEDRFASNVFQRMMEATQIVIAKAEWPKALGSYLYFGSMFANGKLLDIFFFNMDPDVDDNYMVVGMFFDEQQAVNKLLDQVRGKGKL